MILEHRNDIPDVLDRLKRRIPASLIEEILFSDAINEIEQLRAYCNALNARCISDTPDAERYRWLRRGGNNNEPFLLATSYGEAFLMQDKTLDAAIDEAMKGEK